MPTVVKVGGSLLDLPDLGVRLRPWLDDAILIVGGGRLVEELRRLDRIHHFDAEACHWGAIQLMRMNSLFLVSILPGGRLIRHLDEWDGCGSHKPILDPLTFMKEDDNKPDHLPASWDVTSDSIAARVAVVMKCDLILLKSCSVDSRQSWDELAAAGVVDPYFPRLARSISSIQFTRLA